MSNQDRLKWDKKYRSEGKFKDTPSQLLSDLSEFVPKSGKAIDLAGGSGRHSIWLAKRGLDVTCCDISKVGLQIAKSEAAQNNVVIQTIEADLEISTEVPTGPWDFAFSILYLNRSLWKTVAQNLSTDGVLMIVQPTKKNRMRHVKPPEAFLLEDGELGDLNLGLERVYFHEGWSSDDRHDAVLIAKRS